MRVYKYWADKNIDNFKKVNTNTYLVNKKQVTDLYKTLEGILDGKNISKAREIIPLDMNDEEYWIEINTAKSDIKRIIDSLDDGQNIYYTDDLI